MSALWLIAIVPLSMLFGAVMLMIGMLHGTIDWEDDSAPGIIGAICGCMFVAASYAAMPVIWLLGKLGLLGR